MTTLISFLGKGRREKETNRYRSANYRFAGGCVNSLYFGLALARQLKVEKLVILGTAGSIWDVFAEDLVDDDAALSELAEIDLYKAVADESVEQAMLDRLAPLLRTKIRIDVAPVLIPYARDERQQFDVLRSMAEHVTDKENVVLDVTHGFRHLPMLALVAARFLQRVRGVSVANIYYGALEMTDLETGETPVLNLDGLLHMLDWVDALAGYENNGDFGQFAHLLAASPEAATDLREASFFERTNNVGYARKPLQRFRQLLDTLPSQPALDLFRDTLKDRTAWASENRFFERQRSLAQLHFNSGDYLRAATLGYEAALSRLVTESSARLDPQNHEHREQVKQDFFFDERKLAGKPRSATADTFRKLGHLRNALVHGTRSDMAEIQRALGSEQQLRAFLSGALGVLD